MGANGGASRAGNVTFRGHGRGGLTALKMGLGAVALVVGSSGPPTRANAIDTGAPPPAATGGSAPITPNLTPRMEKPREAQALSAAFANTAKALRPSVVRIDVEIGAPRAEGRGLGRRNGAPGGGNNPSDEDLRH